MSNIPKNTTVIVDCLGELVKLPGFLESIEDHPVIEQSYVEHRVSIKTSVIEDITHASLHLKGKIASIIIIRPDGCCQPLIRFSDILNVEIETSDEQDCYIVRLRTHSYFPSLLNIEVGGAERENNHVIGTIEVIEGQRWCEFDIQEFVSEHPESGISVNFEGILVLSLCAHLEGLSFVKEMRIPGNAISPVDGDFIESIGFGPCNLYVCRKNNKVIAFALVKEM